jgi:nicotinate-nucleotide--dimethylbenzimidazole phosphoribosyltransferase
MVPLAPCETLLTENEKGKHMDFEELNARIPGRNTVAEEKAQQRLNDIAKPVGSLGELEALLVRIAGVGGEVEIEKRVAFVLAADNGVTAQNVASTPPEITVTMASFMAQRRSSVCLMAAQAHTDITLVDMGMFRRLETPGILDRHIADGTADISAGPAMTVEQGTRAIQTGIDLVHNAVEQGYRLIATGEMGIGNTTTSSAMAAALLHRPVHEVTGRGVGLTDEGLAHKIAVIEQALRVNAPADAPADTDAFDALCRLGGFDIAGMCGLFIGGALYGVPVIIDGFISATAALTAVRLCPKASYALLPSHVSAEPGASLILNELGLTAIIHANMRLGEGTGAVALIPLLDQIIAVYRDLMTFADIGM